MCAAISRSEALAPTRRWADGSAEIGFALRGGETTLDHLYQSDPCRVLFPSVPPGAAPEAVIVTTSGGLVGGDRLRIRLDAGFGTRATVTSQAAEKVYRSTGAACDLHISVSVGQGAFLEWMPQETILFDGARLNRITDAAMENDGRLLAGEFLVFGRRARGERFAAGYLHDRWNLQRDGRLIWADALHLDGDTEGVLSHPFTFDGAAASAFMVYAGADAPDRLAAARELLAAQGDGCISGASCIGEVLLVRLLGPDAQALRQIFTGFWARFRARVAGLPPRVPRVWEV